jgi:poly(A) polymerase
MLDSSCKDLDWRDLMTGTPFQKEILARLCELSHIYIVGGAVRDDYLGIPSKDVDAVMALPLEEINQLLANWGYSPHRIGEKQQTVTLFREAERLDIVSFSGDIESDALRRDFTLNAIYQDFRTGEIKDPLNGLRDLSNRRLKSCGSAFDRFEEDPLRVLRLVRLAVQYDFEIEEDTWLAAVEQLPKLQGVSVERITEELGRILILEDIDKAIGLLDKLEYFKTYIPELARLKGLVQNRYHTKDAWEHTRHVVKNTPPRLLLRLAGLFHDLGKWDTASRECYIWGTLLRKGKNYQVAGFKLVGKQLERWVNKDVEIHGGRFDNHPDTVFIKHIKFCYARQNKQFEWVPEGKRHFLQHEKESARLLKEVLPRFRWSMLLPGGKAGEREVEYLVGHHMLGTLIFMSELKEYADKFKVRSKARRFAWDIGWNGNAFDGQRIENLLELWRADYLGGKQVNDEDIKRLDALQAEIRRACEFLADREQSLNWSTFTDFMQVKGIEGTQYGRFKEQVHRAAIMDTKNSLADHEFLEREYRFFLKSNNLGFSNKNK